MPGNQPTITIPTSVWEQIPVVIIFTLLIITLGWLAFKALSKFISSVTKTFTESITSANAAFTTAIADINKHYATALEKNNQQWQLYFDARSEASKLVNENIVEKLEKLTGVIEKLDSNFLAHDVMERQVLDDLVQAKRRPAKEK